MLYQILEIYNYSLEFQISILILLEIQKLIEIIIRQMFCKIQVITEGDTYLLPNSEVSINDFKEGWDEASDRTL